MEVIHTLCRMCPQGCGLEVTVKNGKPVALKGAKTHPVNKGWLCPKGKAALDLFYSPNRLKSPLIRSNGSHVPVSWDEALKFSSEKLQSLKDQYGPQSLAIYHGEGVGHQELKYYMKRFANVYGTPNFMGVGSLCNAARTMADTLTFGAVTKPDVANTRFLIIWGGNPFASHEPCLPREINRIKKSGGQIAVIDPRKTEIASKADFHLAVKPGRDEILALNMLHVILKEEMWDKEFTEKWTHGFDRLYESVVEDRFSPEKGESLTGVSSGIVRKTARAYASTKPASLSMGNGLEHHSRGIMAMRLIACMKAITGNLDIPGGDLFTPRPKLKDMTSPVPKSPIPSLGSDMFPLLCEARKEAHALSLPKAVLEEQPYPVKGMIISGGNTSLEWPNSKQVREVMDKLEFLLVIDVVKSPDTYYADVVLPACTFLERDEHQVNVYQNLHNIALRRQVVKPIYGLQDQMIWVKLARQMGFGEFFPWDSCEEGIDFIFKGLGITYRDLASKGGEYNYQERRYKKYETEEFNTPTGKVEILSERLKRFGYDPNPVQNDSLPIEKDSPDYPLFLTTGGNLLSYLHWQYRYIPGLRKMAPEPFFQIYVDTAQQYGLSDGDMTEVETEHGKIQIRARLTPNIRPDTIQVVEGWEEANANELTGSEEADPISGFPNLKSLRCKVRKI